MKPFPDFRYEVPYWQKNTFVIGLDEVGRGCLAGPVHVGGVCFPILSNVQQEQLKKLKIHDSKLCSQKKREKLMPKIQESVLYWHVESSSTEDINTLGIVPSIEKAAITIIRKIADQLPHSATCIVFTDSLPIRSLAKHVPIQQVAIYKGDANSTTIAAASILAKVQRDLHMDTLHEEFPAYQWTTNKGYATKLHRDAIKEHGVTPYHRTLYLRNLLQT